MNRKEFLGVLIFGIAMVGILMFGMAKFEKIENGEMVLVNQNQMDR